jgi:nitrite reductase (NADH) small subunit
MASHVVCRVADLPPGSRRLLELDGREIGVFNIAGEFFAFRNRCPHEGGPLCLGKVRGTLLPSQPGEYIWGLDGEILVCPWHGWEFHVRSGRSMFDPIRWRARPYRVTVEPEAENGDDGTWPQAETYPVSVERGRVVVHL